MNIGVLLDTFFHDDKVGIAILLVVLDFILGVLAAFKRGNFRLSYIADFARNDIAFKLAPYFALYAGALVAGQEHFLIEGLDLGMAAGAFYGAIVLAWVGSITNSLMELRGPGAPQTATVALAGAENAAPPKD